MLIYFLTSRPGFDLKQRDTLIGESNFCLNNLIIRCFKMAAMLVALQGPESSCDPVKLIYQDILRVRDFKAF